MALAVFNLALDTRENISTAATAWETAIHRAQNAAQNRLFSRHTTMALIVLYLTYSQVSTVVRFWGDQGSPDADGRILHDSVHLCMNVPAMFTPLSVAG